MSVRLLKFRDVNKALEEASGTYFNGMPGSGLPLVVRIWK